MVPDNSTRAGVTAGVTDQQRRSDGSSATEVVYIVTNQAMPGLIKIGKTNSDLAGRIRGLYSSGVPLPFELFYACEVADATLVEKKLHDAFGDHRISKSREFFRLAPERAQAALSLAAVREVRLNEEEIIEGAEERAEVEAARRRRRFQFAQIGIVPGTELQLYKDPKIVCTTVDDKNKVNFKGDVTSLSDAALQAVRDLGYDWPSASGPWEWSLGGRRLDEIRTEIEEQAD